MTAAATPYEHEIKVRNSDLVVPLAWLASYSYSYAVYAHSSTPNTRQACPDQ